MKAKPISKILATALALIMLFSVIPVSTIAATVDYEAEADDYYKVISKKDWDLAPGIAESEIVLNNDAGDRRQVMHVVEVDINNEYTKVIPSYKGMVPTPGNYGVQIMSEQAAFAEENGYGNVVAAMNISLSWYNSDYYKNNPHLVGEPLGYMILDGVKYTNSQGQTSGAQTCLVINFDEKDGVARPADMPKVEIRSTATAITGWEEQVIPANFGFLVKDGQMVNQTENHIAEGASRSMLGVKADGTIVMVMNDGRQAPYSTGFNDYEMSEAMIKLGCVYAINGDGGGSSQFLSQRPGEELELHCSPSDGAPRATTHGVLVISTAPSTGEFVRAHVETDNQYYTPGSAVQFKAVGADLAGGAATIPEEATWQLADASFGSIDDNGLFVSNGKIGEVEAQLVYNGEVKGSATINIVIPDAVAFGTAEAYTVPFGESVELTVTATYGVFDVTLKPTDYTITFADNTLGTLVGNKYTAGAVKGTTNMTVTLNADATVYKTIPLAVDRGSQVIFDFEAGTEGADLNNWVIKGHESASYVSDISIVTKENGMVHDGDSALAFHFPMKDFIHGSESYEANSITWVGDPILLENAVSIGMWIYIPEEATQTEIALNYVWYTDAGVQQRTTPDLCLNDSFNGIESSGWYYLSVPISKSVAYIEDAKSVAASQGFKRNFFLKFYLTNSGNAGDESSYMGDITYYIDNVTVDYSNAVADRILPVFGSAYAKNISIDTDVALTAGKTSSFSSGDMNFYASVTDNVAIDADSAAVTVDGKEVGATYKNGKITTSDVSLGAGVHRIVFNIADTAGNAAEIVRYVSVAGEAASVSVAPRNPELTTAITGSIYWLDVVAENAEKVDKITLKLDLDTMHSWQLANAELAYNYGIEYFYASPADKDDNEITVILTNKGSDLSGKAVVASLPIRVWSSTADIWKAARITAVSVNVEVEQGIVTFTDGLYETISAEKVHVNTEAYIHYAKMDKTYFANNCFHEHTPVALEDLSATCTKPGYIGRTYCEVCDSVVDWGTTVAATGHNWAINAEGKLACVNGGELYNGIYTDGKEYIDGVVVADGWNEDKTAYYVDGVKVTGSKFIDGVMYTFDENGNYLPDYKYNGFYEINDTVMYFENNEYKTGCQWIETVFYNFDKNGMGYDGEVELCGTKCLFEDGQFVATEGILLAGICGDDVYYVIYADGTLKLDGTGSTMDFPSLSVNPWWRQEYRMNVKKIVIGKGITRIGERVFVNTYATEVVFEEGSQLTTIAKNAFAVMEKLTTITLPEGLKSLGHRSIYHCSNLTDVYLPSSLTTIASDTFEASPKAVLHVVKGSDALIARIEELGLKYEIYVNEEVYSGTCGENASWTLSGGVLKISGSGAMTDFAAGGAPWYKYKDMIFAVEIGKDITSVGSFSFYSCGNLETVTFAEGGNVANIGKGAFGYSGIKEITIPATVKTMGTHVFYNCAKLETVAFGDGNEIVVLDKYTFWNCVSLKNVYIPDGVTSIGSNAFLNIGDATLSVVTDSFAHKYAVKNGIDFVTRAAKPFVKYEGNCGENAKWELYSDGLLKISGSGAMADYAAGGTPWNKYRSEVTAIVIGKDITHVGSFSFYYCQNAATVTFEEGCAPTSIGKGAFGYTGIIEITVPSSVKTMGTHVFYNSTKLETVSFGDANPLSTIDKYTFWNCVSLKNVYIPDGVTAIGTNAFLNIGDVTLSVVTDSFAHTYAEKNGIAFTTRAPKPFVQYEGSCGENAKWELYSDGLLKISGSGAMTDYAAGGTPWNAYRQDVTAIVIGKDITHVGSFSFYYCQNAKTVTFEEGSALEMIGRGGFGYTGIEEVVIPASVKTLDRYAFYFSKELAVVTFAEGSQLVKMDAYAFRGTTSLSEVNGVPANATIHRNAYLESAYVAE